MAVGVYSIIIISRQAGTGGQISGISSRITSEADSGSGTSETVIGTAEAILTSSIVKLIITETTTSIDISV